MDILDGLNQTLFPGHRVIRVNGWEAAEKYPLPRDCEIVMLDTNPESDHIYMKKVDVNGAPTFERYKITVDPVPRFDPDKYVTVNDFDSFKQEILDGFNSLKQSFASNNGGNNNRSSGNGK